MGLQTGICDLAAQLPVGHVGNTLFAHSTCPSLDAVIVWRNCHQPACSYYVHPSGQPMSQQFVFDLRAGLTTRATFPTSLAPQVVQLCEKPRDPPLKYIVVDTPGQIEIFTWSASGQIITDLFASGFPTVVVYVVDTPRCAAPQTFMSNMLQAVSILYKTKLPLLLVGGRTHGKGGRAFGKAYVYESCKYLRIYDPPGC